MGNKKLLHDQLILWADVCLFLEDQKDDYFKEEKIIEIMQKFKVNQQTATDMMETYLKREKNA